MPKRIAKLVLASLALAISAALAACATTPAPANMHVQGRWRLDSQGSDDVAARIASAVRTAQARQRSRRHLGGGPTGGGSDDDGSGGPPGGGGPGGGASGGADDTGGDLGGDLGANGLIGPDFRQLRERLQQVLGSPHTLTFRVQPDDVLIQRDELPARDYQPGETITRFDEYGTAQLKAAWQDDGFVLTERYTSGARVEERYQLDAHGALLFTRALRDPVAGKIEIKSVYERADP